MQDDVAFDNSIDPLIAGSKSARPRYSIIGRRAGPSYCSYRMYMHGTDAHGTTLDV